MQKKRAPETWAARGAISWNRSDYWPGATFSSAPL